MADDATPDLTKQQDQAPDPAPAADLHTLAEVAAVPELAGIAPGSPEHLDLLSKAGLALHARVSLLETYVKELVTSLDGVPRVFHE